jgi:ferredoxin
MAQILYQGKVIPQRPQIDLLGQILEAGGDVPYICMAGSCGTCRVRIIAGSGHLAPLTAMETLHGCVADVRLACQAVCRGTGDVTVTPV